MKIIVAGSTGFVATEFIKQALSKPAVTSIIALARRQTPLPESCGPNADKNKFKSVICQDFLNYPDDVKRELSGADACVWLIAITPSQLKTTTLEEARRVCLDYTVAGLETMSKLPRDPASKPFRFLYVSGHKSERDQTKRPWPLTEYLLMRGEAENRVLDFAKASNSTVEACVAKPGLIDGPDRRQGLLIKTVSTIGRTIIGLPKVDVSQIAATLLQQAMNGIEKETLSNEDLVAIGDKALAN